MRHDYNVDARRSAQPSQWRPSLVMTTGAGMHAHVMEHFEPISKLEVLHGG